MGYGTYTMVTFRSDDDNYSGLSEIAKKHADAFRASHAKGEAWVSKELNFILMAERDAVRFLDALANKTIVFPDSTYGYPPLVWAASLKNSDGAEFCQALEPFFEEILKTDDIAAPGVPFSCSHILVFSEFEQSPLKVREYRLKDEATLVHKDYEPGFGWNN